MDQTPKVDQTNSKSHKISIVASQQLGESQEFTMDFVDFNQEHMNTNSSENLRWWLRIYILLAIDALIDTRYSIFKRVLYLYDMFVVLLHLRKHLWSNSFGFFPLKEQSWDLQWKQSNLFLQLSILDQESEFFRKFEMVTADIHPIYLHVRCAFFFSSYSLKNLIGSKCGTPSHFRYFELNADTY